MACGCGDQHASLISKNRLLIFDSSAKSAGIYPYKTKTYLFAFKTLPEILFNQDNRKEIQ